MIGRQRALDNIVASLIGLLFVVCGLRYIASIPPFEGQDEFWHFLNARAIADGELPIQPPGSARVDLLAHREAAQPPLYYALAGLAIGRVPIERVRSEIVPNPHGSLGGPGDIDNKNMFAHPPGGDPFADVIRPGRLVSLFFGLGTVLLTYATARPLMPGRFEVAPLAAGLVAFLPGFLFISALVSNDAAIAFFGIALVSVAIAWIRTSVTPGAIALAGLVLGGAALTKSSGLIGLPLLAAVGSLDRGRTRAHTVAVVASALVAAAVAGWWYLRNLRLYGDLTGLRAHLGRDELWTEMPTVWGLLADLEGLNASFIGVFGWFSVRMPDRMYDGYNALFLLGIGGLVLGVRRRLIGREIWICLLWLLLIVGSLLIARLIFRSFHGRLLYPALGTFAILWAIGLCHLLPARIARPASALLLLALAAVAWIVPAGTIRAAYARPERSACAQAGPAATGGDAVVLAAATLPDRDARSGETIPIVLCWLARTSIHEPLSVTVQLVAPGETVFAQRDGFPGSGNDATLWWEPDSLHEDPHLLTIPRSVPAPAVADVRVALYAARTMRRITLGSGQDTLVVGRVRIMSESAAHGAALAQFSDGAQVLDFQTEVESRRIDGVVRFGTARSLDRDHVISIQLVGPHGLVAQQDRQPRGGLFPTTVWRPGDVVPHPFVVEPAEPPHDGQYDLILILYDLPDVTRIASGERDHVVLTSICARGGAFATCP